MLVRGGKALSHADEAIDAVRVAGHLTDNAREGIRLVEQLAEVGRHTDEGRAIIKRLANLSTYGPREGLVVLGRYRPDPGYMRYIDKAREMRATYFDTPGDLWGALNKVGIDPWEINKQFLDEAVARGDKFFVEANLNEIYEHIMSASSIEEAYEMGGYLYKEIYYLIREQGYRVVDQYLVK